MLNSTFILIVTYNGMQWIDQCLSSCKGYPVVVIDNGSTDNTVTYINENYPEVKLLQQKINLGFGAANNIGIKYAINNGADYVFLMNQDCYLQPNTIENLIKVHLSHKDYGILSPVHLNGAGSKLDKNFSYYLKQNDALLYDILNTKGLKSVYAVSFVNAAAWLLPKQTLETVGGFDPIFFHYGEDDNYCQRILYHGFKIGVHPNAFVYHDRKKREAKVEVNLKDRLLYRERHLKSKWANLNLDTELDIKNEILNKQELILKLFLKLKFKKAKYHWNELRMIKSIVIEVEESRNINKVTGNHYLS